MSERPEPEPELPAGEATPGWDSGGPGPAAAEPGTRDREQNAEAAAGAEYAELSRAAVTNVYVSDYRRIGVYAEGNVRARDVTGRDKTASDDSKGRQPVRTVSVVAIARAERDKLSRVEVRAGEHERAGAILERERLAILRGPVGIGKGTAGLSLLGFDHEVLSVDPSVTARDLADFKQRFPYGKGRRYLVEGLQPATAAQLSRFVIRKTLQQLSWRGSYLVMTVDDRTPLHPDLASYVVRWTDRPDIAVVLRRHLGYYLPADKAVAVEATLDLPALCAGMTDRGLGSVDEIAQAIATAYARSRPLDSLLDGLGFGARERAAEWFSTSRSPRDLGLLLAITVLGGCPYSTVTSHAKRLEKLIAERSLMSHSARRLDPLQARSQRVRESMAVLEPGFVDTEYGQSPANLVRLESRWLVQAVLGAVWREYNIVADALVVWLREVGDDPDPGVRLRAAAAVGWLSQYEFATLRERVLMPWARGSSRAAWAAADALGQAAWLDAAAPMALGLLSVWASQEADYDLWWTAAVACGGETGVRYVAIAMDQLRGIAGRDDDRASPVVAQSVVRLVASGGRFAPEIAAYVLAHLANWLDDTRPAAHTAQRAFAELMRRASDPDWPSSAEHWKLLTAPDSQDSSAALLRALLAAQAFRLQGLEYVEFMVRAGDTDDRARQAMTELLKRVADSADIDRQRLHHYLNRWATGTDPSPAARAIADRLEKAPTP